MLLGAAAAIVATPLVFNPFGFDQFSLPRLAALVIGVTVAVGAGCVAGVALDRLQLMVAALVGWMAVCTLFAASPRLATVGTTSRRFGLLAWVLMAVAFVAGQQLDDARRRQVLHRTLIAASLPIAGYAVCQRAGLDPFTEGGGQLRPGSTVGGATFLGAVLAVAVVLALAALVQSVGGGRPTASWAYGLVALVDLVALVITASRGAWIGAAAGGMVVLVASGRMVSGRSRRALVAGALAAAAAALLVLPGAIGRAGSIARVTEGTAGGRLELLQMGAAAVWERPLVGWGPDQSRPALHAQIAADFEARYGDQRIEDRVHNVFVDVAVWGGLPAAALLLAAWALVARRLWSRRDDWTVLATGAALTAFAVHLLFNFPVSDIDPLMWLLAGAGVGVTGRRLPAVPPFVVVPVAVALAVPFAVVLGESVVADRQVRVAVDAERRGDLTAAGRGYRDASEMRPRSASNAEILTRFLLRVDDPSGARQQAATLIAADPTDPYARELAAQAAAAVALDGGDQPAALTAEDEARALLADSPHDGSLHLVLGNALAAQGRLDEAAVEYQVAAALILRRSEPFRNLGLLREQQRRFEEAADSFRRALQVDPNDRLAADGLARVEPLG